MSGLGRLGSTHVEWLGKEIELRLIEKTIAAADATLDAATQEAKANHWWSNRTGGLEANTFFAPAKLDGLRVKGRFGSGMRAEGFYGLFLERRTPWLRPAADRTFPAFAATLARLWRI